MILAYNALYRKMWRLLDPYKLSAYSENMTSGDLDSFYDSPDVIDGHVKRRIEFEDAVDAGTYLDLLLTAADIELDRYTRNSFFSNQAADIERTMTREIRQGGPLPQLARRGIVAAGIPQTFFLLEHVPREIRNQTTVVYRDNHPWVLMPRLTTATVQQLRSNQQVAVLDMNPEEPVKLRHPREEWPILATRMHEAVYYAGIRKPDLSTLPPKPPHHPTPPNIPA
jgi:hypothetical protein